MEEMGSRPGLKDGAQLEAFAREYRLTPAELRLVRSLQRGSGLKVAARSLGIGYETVRTQLKSVFSKTGAHRQAEIVSMVSSYGKIEGVTRLGQDD